MLDKELGKSVALGQREQFLRDNCDAVEEVSYAKMFTPEELAMYREQLTDSSIKIADIEEEKLAAMNDFKERLKPHQEMKASAIRALRDKSRTITEPCFKFYDEETKMIGYYNKEGNLVNSRPAFPNETQKTVFQALRASGE